LSPYTTLFRSYSRRAGPVRVPPSPHSRHADVQAHVSHLATDCKNWNPWFVCKTRAFGRGGQPGRARPAALSAMTKRDGADRFLSTGGIDARHPWRAPLRGGFAALRRPNRQSLPICRTRAGSSTRPVRHNETGRRGSLCYRRAGLTRAIRGARPFGAASLRCAVQIGSPCRFVEPGRARPLALSAITKRHGADRFLSTGGIDARHPWRAPLRGGFAALRRPNRQSLPICRTRAGSSTRPVRHNETARRGSFLIDGPD